MANPRRQLLYEMIRAEPGANFVRLVGAMEATTGNRSDYGTVAHHLYTLERARLIQSFRLGRCRRYVAVDPEAPTESVRRQLALMRDPGHLAMLEAVRDRPGISQRALHRLLAERGHRFCRQTIAYRVLRLVAAGLVGEERRGGLLSYCLTEGAAVVLAANQS